MKFKNETEFENYIRQLIADRITAKHAHVYALDNKKAVDILICRDAPLRPALYFLEVKYHKKSHGRLGFGSRGGGGFQPEIVSRKPEYFETNLRWVIGSEEQNDFLFVSSDVVRQFISGGEVGDKFNNIQTRIFTEASGCGEEQFVEELTNWVLAE